MGVIHTHLPGCYSVVKRLQFSLSPIPVSDFFSLLLCLLTCDSSRWRQSTYMVSGTAMKVTMRGFPCPDYPSSSRRGSKIMSRDYLRDSHRIRPTSSSTKLPTARSCTGSPEGYTRLTTPFTWFRRHVFRRPSCWRAFAGSSKTILMTTAVSWCYLSLHSNKLTKNLPRYARRATSP